MQARGMASKITLKAAKHTGFASQLLALRQKFLNGHVQ
jgi:hypothetical protein